MKKPIGVKILNQYIKNELSVDPILKNLFVLGEITNLHKNKYSYFDLKEDDDLINCVYFNNDYELKNGDNIVISGQLTTYTKASKYQIKVNKIDIVGQGESYYQLQLLKEKLYKLGYFDEIRKKKIGRFPINIGLVTSDKSAAVVDFLTIIKDSYPLAKIFLYSTRVQGLYAQEEIIKAINTLDKMDLDLIVLTRGGGSKEDLALFNEEAIARAIFYADTPMISAVGHEIDITIVDLVSDLRVSTPTKAAEYIASPFINSKELISKYHFDNNKFINNYIDKLKNSLEITFLENEKNSPQKRIEKAEKNIDLKSFEIKNSLDRYFYRKIEELNSVKFEIDDLMNKLIHDNMMKIMDLNKELVDVDQLEIGGEYILTNDKSIYKINVLERLDGR